MSQLIDLTVEVWQAGLRAGEVTHAWVAGAYPDPVPSALVSLGLGVVHSRLKPFFLL